MYGWRAKIAFMLPSSCTVFEQEFLAITAGLEGVIGCPARLLIEDTDDAGLSAMNEGIGLAARQLATTAPDVVVYMCTSGSFKDGRDGNEAIKEQLRGITGCGRVTTTSEAVVEAMKTLGLRRVAMLTPYDEDITRKEIDYLQLNGITVSDYRNRDIQDNLDRGSIPLEESLRYALELDHATADGLFLSCANVPAIQIVETLEERTGRPVVTSSQATVWKSLRMAGISEPVAGYGALLRDN